MKTTVNIDDTVMVELKREAARQGRTISELVETALRLLLRSQRFPMLRGVRHRAARLARPHRSRPDPCSRRRPSGLIAIWDGEPNRGSIEHDSVHDER
jgi:Ribbon-helix-helix protein, copG family